MADERDDDTTLVTCLACDGNYQDEYEHSDGRYSIHLCPWCTKGSMTKKQVDAWRHHVTRRKSDPKFKPFT